MIILKYYKKVYNKEYADNLQKMIKCGSLNGELMITLGSLGFLVVFMDVDEWYYDFFIAEKKGRINWKVHHYKETGDFIVKIYQK